MINLQKAIVRRYNEKGGELKRLLGVQAPALDGFYAGSKGPRNVPKGKPFVFFETIGSGERRITMPVSKKNTYETVRYQFTMWAQTLEELLNIMQALKDLYDDWEGPLLGKNGEVVGRIVSTDRSGPGSWVEDPDEGGWDGYVDFKFKYCEK